MSLRNRMRVIDGRTGRLEYAVAMVEDGVVPKLYVRRGEADPANPKPLRIGPDRATLRRPGQGNAPERTPFTFYVGITIPAGTNLWEERTTVVMTAVPPTGTFEATIETGSVDVAFGALAFGAGTFGGAASGGGTATITEVW